jgi:valyl-tRNA synthetase
MAEHPGGSVPFRQVYIHALVRDAERKKMSKTKGNVLDPIEVIGEYGTDATRFTLAAMAAPGTDIAFNSDRTQGYRAFANKIWNAARFMFMNVDKAQQAGIWSLDDFRKSLKDGKPGATISGCQMLALEDRWIFSRFNGVTAQVHQALAEFRFHEAANCIYDFFWGEFCDWYIELVKPRVALGDTSAGTVRTASQNLVALFEASLRLLHPFMPFITEEIWQAVYDGKPPLKSIALAAFPEVDPAPADAAAETSMAILQDLIVSIRNLRADLKVEPKEKVPVQIYANAEIRTLVDQNRSAVERLGGAEKVTFVEASLAKLPGARSTARFEVRVVYEKKIDIEAERKRLTKELAGAEKEKANIDGQLGNVEFLSKAPAHVVEKMRLRAQELIVLIEKIRSSLNSLE